jgi:formylmethanofuran--tetrahydromethanopterin N-formyltransferase
MTGFATSVIACGCEAGIEKEIRSSETPDGRSGIAVLLFAMDSKGLAKQVLRRVGQCILTSPTTACFSGLESDEKIDLGNAIRYFGDGFQVSKKINDKKIWRIPVMEGEFVIEDKTSIANGIGGGNILIIGDSNQEVLKSSEAAVKEMRKVNNIILPFPGGIVRSGSKVGSKYKSLIASTNDAYCPTLKGITKTKLSKSNESVLEIVIDGTNEKDISLAMKKGINIICKKFNKGIRSISAGNYGGKLGPYHFHLRDIMK